ncbi:unnamed protein product, partial [Brenthis ino]
MLDLVLTNWDHDIAVEKSTSYLSKVDQYHPPIEITISLPKIKSLKCKPFLQRNFFKADYNQINERLSSIDWHDQLNKCSSVDDSVAKFYSIIGKIIEENVPKYNCNRNSKYPRWYSKNLIKLLKEKEKHRKLFKIFGNKLDEYEYDLLKERTTKLIDKLYVAYCDRVEELIIKYPKNFWSYTKSKRKVKSTIPGTMKLGNGYANDSEGVANLFAEHFSSVYLAKSHNTVPFDCLAMSKTNVRSKRDGN